MLEEDCRHNLLFHKTQIHLQKPSPTQAMTLVLVKAGFGKLRECNYFIPQIKSLYHKHWLKTKNKLNIWGGEKKGKVKKKKVYSKTYITKANRSYN